MTLVQFNDGTRLEGLFAIFVVILAIIAITVLASIVVDAITYDGQDI